MTALSDLRYRPEWVRPLDWLPLPDIQPPTEGIAALVAVSEDGYGNLVSLKMTISDSATWTVDWGDGSTPEVIASDGTATHDYDWADVGDVTTEGWRQAVLTVYPATGKTFVMINLAAPVAAGVRNTGWTSPLRSVLVVADVVTALTFNDNMTRAGHSSYVQEVECRKASGQLACFPVCRTCVSLQSLRLPPYTTPIANSTSSYFANARVPDDFEFDWGLLGITSSLFSNGIAPRRFAADLRGGAHVGSFLVNSLGCQSVHLTGAQNVNGWTNFAYSAGISSSLVDVYIDVVAGAGIGFARNNKSIRTLVIDNASGITDTTNFLASVSSLEKLILTGLTIGVSIASCNLGAAALNAFFTSLGTAKGAQTITITNNPGAGTCDTSIATAKGWTVAV